MSDYKNVGLDGSQDISMFAYYCDNLSLNPTFPAVFSEKVV